MGCSACEKAKKRVLAKDPEVKKRLETCYRCPEYNKRWGMCRVCKCIIRLKTALTVSSCPRGKW